MLRRETSQPRAEPGRGGTCAQKVRGERTADVSGAEGVAPTTRPLNEERELAHNYDLSGGKRLSNCCDNLAAFASTAAADPDFMLLLSSTNKRNALISQLTSKLSIFAQKQPCLT